MSIATLIRKMADAGASPEAIAIAVEAIEARDSIEAERKAKRAEQKRSERARRATVARQDGDNAATVCDNPSPKESSPTPPKEITPSSSQDKSCSITPRAALESVLDAERAGAVVDHRKRLGKPLTAHAAKLLADKMARCPDPNFAADEMISNGWLGFKPEWLENRSSAPRQSTDPPRPPRNAGELSYQQLMGQTDEHTSEIDRRLGSGDGDAETPNLGSFQKFAISGELLRRM